MDINQIISILHRSDDGTSPPSLSFNEAPFSRALEDAAKDQECNFLGKTKTHMFAVLQGIGGNRTETNNLVDLKSRIGLSKVVSSALSLLANTEKVKENYSAYKKSYAASIIWDHLWCALTDHHKEMLRPHVESAWKKMVSGELTDEMREELWSARIASFNASMMAQEDAMEGALCALSWDELQSLVDHSTIFMQGIYNKALEYGAHDVFANNVRYLASQSEARSMSSNPSHSWSSRAEQAHELLALSLIWPSISNSCGTLFAGFTAEPDHLGNDVSLISRWEVISGWPSESISSLFNSSWLHDWKLTKESKTCDFVDSLDCFSEYKVKLLKYDVGGERLALYLLDDSFVEPAAPSCSLSDFSYLGGDLSNVIRTLQSPAPQRVLLVGDHGIGKSELLGVLAKHLDRRLLNIVSPAPPDTTVTAQRAVKNIATVQSNTKLLSNSLVVFDSIDQFLSSTSKPVLETFVDTVGQRQHMKTHEIWTVTNLDEVGEALLNGFDMVVRLSTMPLIQRQQLATQWVDDNLARRIAQITTTPGEVVRAAQWVKSTSATEWTDIASFIHGLKEARMLIQKEHEGLPLQVFSASHLNAGFSDVVGDDQCVKKARQIIQALQDPQKFKKMGGQMPKGVLLKGDPGTGKTHLARAMAVEAGVPFLLADSAAMARNAQLIGGVFAEARRQAPCILFLDELDAIGTEAKGAMGASPDPARQGILNRLLMELDGVEPLDGVLVIGATHRSELLDSALVRSGRLGWHIPLSMPDTRARQALWTHYAKGVVCDEHIDWLRIARVSTSLTPADIAQAMNTAVLLAMHDDQESVRQKHLMQAIDEVLMEGTQMDIYTLDEEKRRTAVHEAGHALLAWHFGVEMVKATVRPTPTTLGYVRMLPEDGRHSMSREMVLANIIISFGGLAAEQAHYGSYGTGASMDLKAIRKYAQWLVRREGMHAKLPGGLSTCPFDRPSEEMKFKAEELEFEWIGELRTKTIEWMEANKDHLARLADELYKQNEMDGVEIDAHLNTFWPEGRNMLPSSNPMIAHAAQNLFQGSSKA